MYRRIMAAVDDSFSTSKVLDAAINLARHYDAKLAICHALDVTIFSQRPISLMLPNTLGEVEQGLRDSAREFLDKALDVARAAGVDAEIRIVDSQEEHVAEMLADAAEQWQADLLVVGKHGKRGVERFFVGSVAEQIVSRAGTSLLLVRGPGN